MKENYMHFDELREFIEKALQKVGVPAEDSTICADVLLEADKHGFDSHGMNRLKPIYIDRINDGILNPVTQVEIIKETPTTVVVDGHNGMGMVIANKTLDLCIEKAKKYGMAMGAVRNSTHYGFAGYYPLRCVKEGLIGITGTNARPSIAPTFGVENMLGTNPLTFGFPTDEDFPFLLDCATSVTQRGKIEYYARNNMDTPEGVVVGNEGKSLTDSHEILRRLNEGTAAFTPLGGIGESLGGYKGYGYATVVEILSAALSAGSFLKALSGFDKEGNKIPYPLGHFFIVIDPEAFCGLDEFKKITGEILRTLRNSQKSPGEPKIFTAGEKEYNVLMERKDKGLYISESIQKDMDNLLK
ncbi:MAG: Ldh family oxidoreductase [Anaerovoracaceae bacterium]